MGTHTIARNANHQSIGRGQLGSNENTISVGVSQKSIIGINVTNFVAVVDRGSLVARMSFNHIYGDTWENLAGIVIFDNHLYNLSARP